MSPLPDARNGLRATNVNNIIYLLGRKVGTSQSFTLNFSGGDTEVLEFDSSANEWRDHGRMTGKAGSKLEVSTIDCNLGKPSIKEQKISFSGLLAL